MRRMDGTAGRTAKSKMAIMPAAHKNQTAEDVQAISRAEMADSAAGNSTKGFLWRVDMATPLNTDTAKPAEAMTNGICSCASVACMALTAISGVLAKTPS